MSSEFIFGIHAVQRLLERQLPQVLELWIQENRFDIRIKKIISIAHQHKLAIHQVPRKTLDKLTSNHQHQGIVARCKKRAPVLQPPDIVEILSSCKHSPLILVLEEIQDPHNLGACLRSADAAGVDLVIITRNRSAGITPTVRKIACGAVDTLNIVQVVNLNQTLKSFALDNFQIIGTAGESPSSIYNLDYDIPTVIVMGGEEKGLRQSTREYCSELASIPMKGCVESLNISVATGIFLFEAVRQRMVNQAEKS